MTEPFATQDNHTISDPVGADRDALRAWLDTPPSANAAYELSLLQIHLGTTQSLREKAAEHAALLDRLYSRAILVIPRLIPGLIGVPLPIHRKPLQTVRSIHKLDDIVEELSISIDHATRQTETRPPVPTRQLLWRQIFALSQHLFISYLTASPAKRGIWLRLHHSFSRAHNLGGEVSCPTQGREQNLQSLYLSTILLGCAQPATFNSYEIDFVAACLRSFSYDIESINLIGLKTEATFWIDPERDEPAVACSRKPPPTKSMVFSFSCNKLVSLIKFKLSTLESGKLTQKPTLPAFAETPAGLGVLRRLIKYWGHPAKRRFPRRNQSYRVTLCSGLETLWHLFRDGSTKSVETSNWMVVNESPDGYALMHVSGTTGTLSVGDIVAIKTDSGESWQTSIVRWAISENQEHFEIGLQLLATHAMAAQLILPRKNGQMKPSPVLLLPQVPVLRPDEFLVVPSGTLENQDETFVLLVEKENLSIREIRSVHINEQNSRIEVFSFRPETLQV